MSLRSVRTYKDRRLVVPAALLAFFLGSCTATEDDDTTNVVVQIVSMQSDICLGAPPGCTAVNDFGVVTMIAVAKDILRPIGPATTVIFERIRVTFIRADGRNVPGVEVPFSFDSATNFRVGVNEAAVARAFTVVRQQAKLEPPLANLAFGGGAIVLSVIAQIDFFGRDTAGRPIAVRGFLNITFADFG
jgi:hypothetical protein